MSSLNDLPLNTPDAGGSPASSSPPPNTQPPLPGRNRRAQLVIVIAVVAVLIAAALFFFDRDGQAPGDPTGPNSATDPRPTPPPAPTVVEPVAPPFEPPPLDASDDAVREQAETLLDQDVRPLLGTAEIIRTWVAALDNIAEGRNPRQHLNFLAPRSAFQVERSEGRVYMAAENYRRFDHLAETVAGLDADDLVTFYSRFAPLADEAYQQLGYPEGEFESVLRRSVRRLLRTPILEGEVELRPEVQTYSFLDPQLESLPPAQKSFLRMGPRNMRLVQMKLREVARALGWQSSELPDTPMYRPGT